MEKKKLILFNGQIISTEKIILRKSSNKFEQLNIDLNNLQTDTMKQPKLQERSTVKSFKCIIFEIIENNYKL